MHKDCLVKVVHAPGGEMRPARACSLLPWGTPARQTPPKKYGPAWPHIQSYPALSGPIRPYSQVPLKSRAGGGEAGGDPSTTHTARKHWFYWRRSTPSGRFANLIFLGPHGAPKGGGDVP